jgi:hypothetical protein
MSPLKALLLEIAVAGTLVGAAVVCGGPRFDAEGTWVVDTVATRAARGDLEAPDVSGTLTLDVHGYFHLEILDGKDRVLPRSGVWAAKARGFWIQEGTWRVARGERLTGHARDDGAVVLEVARKSIVLRRAPR